MNEVETRKQPTQKCWVARSRQPATFNVESKSSAFPDRIVEWTIVCSDLGIVATRKTDGRRVSIAWREAVGLAMFNGRDSARDKETKL